MWEADLSVSEGDLELGACVGRQRFEGPMVVDEDEPASAVAAQSPAQAAVVVVVWNGGVHRREAGSESVQERVLIPQPVEAFTGLEVRPDGSREVVVELREIVRVAGSVRLL